jgi:hypothetical protein
VAMAVAIFAASGGQRSTIGIQPRKGSRNYLIFQGYFYPTKSAERPAKISRLFGILLFSQ